MQMILGSRVITLLISVQLRPSQVKEADSQNAITKDTIMDPACWSYSYGLGRRRFVNRSQPSLYEA